MSLSVDEEIRRYNSIQENKTFTNAAKALKINRNTLKAWFADFKQRLNDQGVDPQNLTKAFWSFRLADEEEHKIHLAPPRSDDETYFAGVKEYRHKRERSQLVRERDIAMARASEAEDLRRYVFDLVDNPLEPVSFQPAAPTPGGSSAETIVCFLSDWHWGEVIGYEAMDGINSYDVVIARARAERCFQAILDLATKHWSGAAPERLILILGGDMVSGEIHDELKKTNTLMAMPAVRDVVTYLRAGIELLLDHLQCPIDIISLPGNHGRSTLKPESKLNAETSYDTLVSEFLEYQLKDLGSDRLTFYIPVSNDAVFSVYGWRFLATHGDKIGSKGGQGFVGVAATAARGMKRLSLDYMARGIHIDVILMGHFHAALKLEEGYVNGCLPGPSEYARDGRFRPAPASQLFIAVHPRRGVSQYRYINVGEADEGSLYERPEPSNLRPKYRVKAGSVKG